MNLALGLMNLKKSHCGNVKSDKRHYYFYFHQLGKDINKKNDG